MIYLIAAVASCLQPLCVSAQSAPTGSISYAITGASTDGKTASLTLTASNALTASTAATTASVTGTTNETPARTINGVVTIAPVNNVVTSPTLSVALPVASPTTAGLTAPAAGLPAGVTVSGNVLTWIPGKLDGGQSVTVTVTGFSVVQPVAPPSAGSGSGSR